MTDDIVFPIIEGLARRFVRIEMSGGPAPLLGRRRPGARRAFASLPADLREHARRAYAQFTGDEVVWLWVGSHDDYERLLGKG